MTAMTECWLTDPHGSEAPAVLHQVDGLQVLAQRQEVMFKDGSTVHLHPVLVGSKRNMFLRALQGDGQWLLTDLRAHGPELEADVLRLQPRDTPGVVFFTLRAAYRCRLEFLNAVALQAKQRALSPAFSPVHPPAATAGTTPCKEAA